MRRLVGVEQSASKLLLNQAEAAEAIPPAAPRNCCLSSIASTRAEPTHNRQVRALEKRDDWHNARP